MTIDNETARREYWSQQMEEAAAFIEAMREYPVQECLEPLASMTEAVERAGVEAEFSTSKIALNLDRVFFLRAGLIDGFIGAAREMNQRGWTMKVEDGFRSLEMQQNVTRRPLVFDAILKTTIWELNGQIPSPEFMLRRVSALTAIRPKVGTHMSGSAIDISVFSRDDGNEIDRGAPYIEMSELTPMASPFVSPQAQKNRQEITEIMARHGFIAYPYEFWHYNSGDCYAETLTGSGEPARYGAIDFDLATGTIEPISDPDQLLQPHNEIQNHIEQSLARLQNL